MWACPEILPKHKFGNHIQKKKVFIVRKKEKYAQ